MSEIVESIKVLYKQAERVIDTYIAEGDRHGLDEFRKVVEDINFVAYSIIENLSDLKIIPKREANRLENSLEEDWKKVAKKVGLI